jgi:hypothetical protein
MIFPVVSDLSPAVFINKQHLAVFILQGHAGQLSAQHVTAQLIVTYLLREEKEEFQRKWHTESSLRKIYTWLNVKS